MENYWHVAAAAETIHREREEILIGVRNGKRKHIRNLYTIPHLHFMSTIHAHDLLSRSWPYHFNSLRFVFLGGHVHVTMHHKSPS